MKLELDEGLIADRSAPGPDLYFRSTLPSVEPKAALTILHGYADHSARYAHVMGALAEQGIACVAIDMRGHGRAGGPRGACGRFSEYLDDAAEGIRLTRECAKGTKCFLLGHSFGGLVAASRALAGVRDLSGLVLSSPFFGVALEVPKIKVLAAKAASVVYPALSLPSGLSGKDCTHDAERARAYDEDPLVFPNANARWFVETVAAQERALESAKRLDVPLYMFIGTADKIVSVSAARRFYDATGSEDRTYEPKEGLYHEVLNEPSWKDSVDAIAKWILARA